MNWQPIDTAPKDGNVGVLLRVRDRLDDYYCVQAWWQPGSTWNWCVTGLRTRLPSMHVATHWMPLPPPPSKETP